jgi:hypothetical protein
MTVMRRTLGATLMLLAAWPAPPALADPIVVDQSNLLTSGGFGGAAISPAQGFGQTFTVGVTGILRGIDLQLHQGPGTLGDVRLDLLPTLASGEPAGLDRSLFATVIPVDQIFTLRSPSDDVPVLSVPILSDAVSVQTGQTLAISLRRFEGSSAPPETGSSGP